MATKKNTSINGSQYYRITRTIGHAPDGAPIKKQFYGSSKGDAESKYNQFLQERARKKYSTGLDTHTLGARAEEYVEYVLKVSQRYAQGTIDLYVGAYNNHVKDAPICSVPIEEIKAIDIQRFYNSLDVSQQTLKRVNKFMRAFWKWLVANGYATDILSAVEIPRKENNKKQEGIEVWEDSEILAVIHALETAQNRHRLHFMLYVLLYTGMRISEVLGLKYSDIEDDVIHVERQYYLKEIKEPKFGSKRIVPLHAKLKEQLPIHKAWHEEEMKKRGYETDFVFTTTNGRLYDRSSVRKALKRFYDANNIPYHHIHAFRATFCTQMCRCDIPLEIASKILGHKSLDVTAQHYALVKKDTMADAIARFSYR